MIHAQNFKFVSVTPPAAIVDAGSYTTAAIDTAGYDYCTIIAYLGATDIAMAALKVQESDDSGMSGAADVTGLVVGTSNNIAGSTSALPSATDDNKAMCFEVKCGGDRKRYLDLVATAGDGTAGSYLTVFALLSKGEAVPVTAAERGFDEILRV
jgi:hypothetical protein